MTLFFCKFNFNIGKNRPLWWSGSGGLWWAEREFAAKMSLLFWVKSVSASTDPPLHANAIYAILSETKWLWDTESIVLLHSCLEVMDYVSKNRKHPTWPKLLYRRWNLHRFTLQTSVYHFRSTFLQMSCKIFKPGDVYSFV